MKSPEDEYANLSSDEDPTEVYKQAFKYNRWLKEKQEKERVLRNERSVFKVMRFITWPILFFAVFLIIDSVWPAKVYYEEAQNGWQKRFGRGRGASLVSYMETKSFLMVVPHEIHLNYPYYGKKKVPLIIATSPFLNIPKTISLKIGKTEYRGRISDTIYYFIPFHCLLFLSAFLTVWRKKYSHFNYVLSFFPTLILCFVILRMM